MPKKVTRTTTATAENPLYDQLVVGAQATYSSEPPPYRTGTCS